MRRARWLVILLYSSAIGVTLVWFPYATVALLCGMMFFLLYAGSKAQEHAVEVGYFEARTMMWTSMSEAMDRGMSLDDWMEAEAERDRLRLLAGPRKGFFISPSEEPPE
jgi:hypothetical protein